jgi:hypothetical protein
MTIRRSAFVRLMQGERLTAPGGYEPGRSGAKTSRTTRSNA